MILALFLACAAETNLPSGAAPYEPGPECAWTATAVSGDEDPGLGVTLDEHLAALEGTVESTLSWDHTGEETALTTSFAATAAEWLEGELVDPETGEPWVADTGMSSEEACPPHLRIAGSFTLDTADGRLAESLAVEVESIAAGVGRIDHDLPYEDLAGDAPPLGIDPGDWDSITVDLAVNLSASSCSGELAYTAQRTTDTEDVSQTDDFARW